jgi:hypothetical protein
VVFGHSYGPKLGFVNLPFLIFCCRGGTTTDPRTFLPNMNYVKFSENTSTAVGHQLLPKTGKTATPIRRLYRHFSAASLGVSTKNLRKSLRGGKKDEAPKIPGRKGGETAADAPTRKNDNIPKLPQRTTSTRQENHAPSEATVQKRSQPLNKKQELTLEEVFSEYDLIVGLHESSSSLKALITSEGNETEQPKGVEPVEDPSLQALETVPTSTDTLAPVLPKFPGRGKPQAHRAPPRRKAPIRRGLPKQTHFKDMQQFFSSYEKIVDPEFNGESLTGW